MTAPGDPRQQEDGLREAIARLLWSETHDGPFDSASPGCRFWLRVTDRVLALPEVAGLRAKVERDAWQEAAEKFCDDYHAELSRRIDAEVKVERVAALARRAREATRETENPGAATVWLVSLEDALASRPTTHESAEEGEG